MLPDIVIETISIYMVAHVLRNTEFISSSTKSTLLFSNFPLHREMSGKPD